MLAWEEVVDRHARLVFGVAYRVVGQIHDAEDVAQDTFREAFELANRGQVTDWRGCLCRIATFRGIDVVRRRRKVHPLEGEHTAGGASPIDELDARELGERLQASLPELPRQAAAVFSLTYFENMSRSDVAAALDMTPTAVSVALFKARKHLQALLLPESLQAEPDQQKVCHESE
jgi:RNA polymerase sigma-70 factor (ECF subfamily)